MVIYMRLEQLECLLEVAQTNSISKAADGLFLTQQAVSLNIKQLEKELNCKLLVRAKKGVMLTKEGIAALEFAKKVLNEKELLKQEIDRLHKRNINDDFTEVTICSTSTVTNIVLPKIIGDINRIGQPIHIKVDISSSIYTLMETVKSDEADIGLVSFNEKELYRILDTFQNELAVEILARDELLVVIDKSHYSGELTYIKREEYFNPKNVRTLYNVVPIDEVSGFAKKAYIVSSNDAEFHRNMLEKAGAMVMMSGLAYDNFFKSKKFVALPIEDVAVDLIHAAVYKKNCKSTIQNLINQIRKEMYVQ